MTIFILIRLYFFPIKTEEAYTYYMSYNTFTYVNKDNNATVELDHFALFPIFHYKIKTPRCQDYSTE